MAVVLFYVFCQYVIFLILIIVTKCVKFRKLSKFKKNLKETLVFSELIVIYKETYIELLIASFLVLNARLTETNGEIISMIMAIVSIVILLIGLPASLTYIMTKKIKRLESEHFKGKWGELYSGIRLKTIL